MVWIGKISGGLIGYALARLPGAVLGVLLGHQFDRGMEPRRKRRRRSAGGGFFASAADRQRVFFETTFIVMGRLAKVDGRVSEAEIDAARNVMRQMQLDKAGMRLAIGLFNAGKRPDYPVDAQLERLRRYAAGQPQLLRTFLEIQLDLATAKGVITAPERELLLRVAASLGIGPAEFAQLEALHHGRRRFGEQAREAARTTSLDAAYRVLGVEPLASNREIKTAYRRLMNRHHPDKQAARGLPDSMLEIAKQRTGEVRAAYDAIRAHRGFR